MIQVGIIYLTAIIYSLIVMIMVCMITMMDDTGGNNLPDGNHLQSQWHIIIINIFLMIIISIIFMIIMCMIIMIQVGIIYLTAIIYSPTSAELKAGLEEQAVMCTSLIAERVITIMVVVMIMVMMMAVMMAVIMAVMMMVVLNQVDCGSSEWLSCQEWCLAGSSTLLS